MDTEKLVAEFTLAAVKELGKSAMAGGLDAGGKLWGWIKGKASGPDAAAIAAVEAAPQKPSSPDRVSAVLKDLLVDQPQLAQEMVRLLQDQGVVLSSQTATTTGSGNATAQVAGSGNTVKIHR